MKLSTTSISLLTALPAATALPQQLFGPFFAASFPNGLSGSGSNLTASDGNILIGNADYARLLLLEQNTGFLDALGFGEGYSRVYADPSDGSVHYTAPGQQPPAGALASWSVSLLEADPSKGSLVNSQGLVQSCTDPSTGLTTLHVGSQLGAGCAYTQVITTPSGDS